MWIEDKFLAWWLHGPRYGWSKFRRRLFEGGFRSKPLPEVHSMDDILACLQKVVWKKDLLPQLFDCVSYPQRVWAKQTDDCDGFAILTAEAPQALGPGDRSCHGHGHGRAYGKKSFGLCFQGWCESEIFQQ